MSSIKPTLDPEDEAPTELFVSAQTFQGKPLWPLTLESDMIMAHVSAGNELVAFSAMAFIFVHMKRGGADFFADLERIMPILWTNPDKFRVEVLRHFSTLPPAAKQEAFAVFRAAYGLVKKQTVNPGSLPGSKAGGAISKKKATTRRATSGARSGSRRRSG
jgi:hypothetical protein